MLPDPGSLYDQTAMFMPLMTILESAISAERDAGKGSPPNIQGQPDDKPPEAAEQLPEYLPPQIPGGPGLGLKRGDHNG